LPSWFKKEMTDCKCIDVCGRINDITKQLENMSAIINGIEFKQMEFLTNVVSINEELLDLRAQIVMDARPYRLQHKRMQSSADEK
jgi:hypothetical protein